MNKKARFTKYTLFSSIIAAIGGFLFGYNTAVISGALLFMTKDFYLTTLSQELIVSIILVGALIGACLGGLLTDKIGRKFTLFITTILFFIGTIIVMKTSGIAGIFIGRLILGLGIGIASITVPLYIAEISDPVHRGALVSLNQLAITLGILIAYIVNYYYAPTYAWRSMFAAGLIPAGLLFLGLFFIPESPTYLVTHNKKTKALKILKKILLDSSHSEVIIESHKRSHKETISWKQLFAKTTRPAFFAGIGISIFQQITGINIVIYYAPKIFQMAGLELAASALFATIGIGTINFLMTIFALWLVDNVGRKPLLIIGLIGMIISLGVLGYGFMNPNQLSTFSVVSLMCYVAFFAISLGPVAWLIISEVYPMGIRGRAMGISSFANWSCNYIVSLTFLTLVEILGKSLAFWLYALICLFALWFVLKKIPETKGRELQDIQNYFKKKALKKNKS